MRRDAAQILQRLRALQERHSVSYKEFAARVGVASMTAHRWLSGARTPTPETLDRILVAFGETPAVFWDRAEATAEGLALLDVIAATEPEVLRSCYGLDPDCDAELDAALYAYLGSLDRL